VEVLVGLVQGGVPGDPGDPLPEGAVRLVARQRAEHADKGLLPGGLRVIRVIQDPNDDGEHLFAVPVNQLAAGGLVALERQLDELLVRP